MALLRNRLLSIVLGLGLASNPIFVVELQPPTSTIPATYFGLHIHHLDRPTPTPWPNMPVPAWRLWDAEVTWSDLEPNKGQWQFGRLDRYVSLAQQNHTALLLALGGCPPWASSHPRLPSDYSPGFTAPPANIEDWRNYVRTIATRYKGRIEGYEIWNEPNLSGFWSGTTDQIVMLTKEASQIIHAVDPSAKLVSPSATAAYGVPWLGEFLQKGGGQYVDVIGFHFYVDPHTLAPEDMIPVIQRVRQVMTDNGMANKPLWNTETGWLQPAKFDSDEIAAGFLARAYILSWAAGVQRFYWYAWDNRSLAIVTYKEAERKTTPAGSAYKIMEEWLVGARMDSCTESADHTWTCQLNRSGKKEWIVWNSQGSHKFDVPEAWHAKTVKPLLENQNSLKGSSIDIGPVPTRLTGRS